jgi:threonine aldolase
LTGSKDFISAARRWRKALGGGMRQAGVLAAAGLHALENHVQRLAEDHANAEYLAAGLAAIGLKVVPPQTNMVYVEVANGDVEGLNVHLKSLGILATIGTPRTRLVTHLDLSRAKVDTVLQAFRDYPHWQH